MVVTTEPKDVRIPKPRPFLLGVVHMCDHLFLLVVTFFFSAIMNYVTVNQIDVKLLILVYNTFFTVSCYRIMNSKTSIFLASSIYRTGSLFALGLILGNQQAFASQLVRKRLGLGGYGSYGFHHHFYPYYGGCGGYGYELPFP